MGQLMERSEHARATPGAASAPQSQQPFARVAPLLRAAPLLGAAGGFVLASVLSVSLALRLPLGAWWSAVAQAHGHLQVYGWAGLFVLGVAFHFLPRLRGAPMRWPSAVPWLMAALLTALVLRAVSQPLLAMNTPGARASGPWHVSLVSLLVASGVLEVCALGGLVVVLLGTMRRHDGPALRKRPALWSIWPFLLCSLGSLGLAALINLANVVQTAQRSAGLMPATGDGANVLLGLYGFLMPMALAMSARALPTYAGLDAFPQCVLWPAAFAYCAGIVLALVGTASGMAAGTPLAQLGGLGLALMGAVLVSFIALFVRLMAGRGRLPKRVQSLSPTPEQSARNYTRKVANERATYGPYVALIGSAYVWALLAGLLLLDGIALGVGATPPMTLDAPRHALAVGFIALLLAGVSARMIPGFSGGHLASPRWVVALLWLGNGAALLRVGSLLLAPMLAGLGDGGSALDSTLFGISGPLGLAFAVCLAINLWPALVPNVRPAADASNSAPLIEHGSHR